MISNELLKKKILDEAIHGRLIENDPSLKPIDVESINDDIPFEIPNNWKWVEIKNVVNMASGGTPSRNIKEYWENGNIPWVKISDMKEKYLNSTDEFITNDGLKNSSAKIFPKGTILYSIFATIGNVSILNIDASTNQAIVGLTPKVKIDINFLYFILKHIKDFINQLGKGTSQLNINQQVLKKTLIPLPPLEEQKKIVKKIEELFELIDKKEKNDKEKEKLKTLLTEKILDSAIRGKLIENDLSLPAVDVEEIKDNVPFDIPNNWKWSKLGKISDYGKNKKVKGINISKNQWILELEDIEKNTGKILNKIYQVDRNAISDKNMFFKGNLLYGKLRPYLNKCVIADEDGFCCTEIEPIVLINNIEVKYVQKVLMSRYFLNYVASCSYGAKMPRLGTKDAKNAMISIPPLEQQKKIVEKIEECFKLIEQL